MDSSTFGRLHKTPFFLTLIQTLYCDIPVSGQLQLRTSFQVPRVYPSGGGGGLYVYKSFHGTASFKDHTFACSISQIIGDVKVGDMAFR